MRAAVLTIGNEVVSGDIANTNATWLAQRMERVESARPMLDAITHDLAALMCAPVPGDNTAFQRMRSLMSSADEAARYRALAPKSIPTMNWATSRKT